jgi:hypothetical protein
VEGIWLSKYNKQRGKKLEQGIPTRVAEREHAATAPPHKVTSGYRLFRTERFGDTPFAPVMRRATLPASWLGILDYR